MKFKTGDKVKIIAGKDKGNTGRISKILGKKDKVLVEGQNMVKKHIKPNANNQNGGIISTEAPIHASNIMFVDEKTNKTSRKRIVAAPKKEAKEVKEIKETKETKDSAPKKAKAKKVK